MWVFLILLFLVFILWSKPSHEVKAGGYESKYFHISGGKSKELFEKMKSEGVSEQSLMEFAQMVYKHDQLHAKINHDKPFSL